MKNKLTKVGLSALCGSLTAVAAHAGEISVSGGATATWTSLDDEVTGNPIGINSGITFSGSGELDNGTAVTLTITEADQSAFSAMSIVMDTPSMGSITIGGATGGLGIGAYDDKMPTAWEETWGSGLSGGIDLAKGVGSSMAIQWASPTVAGTTLKIAHAPTNSGNITNDKAVNGDGGGGKNEGTDIVLDIAAGGQNVFVGYSHTDRDPSNKSAGTNGDNNEDIEQAVAGAILTIGPVKVGAQVTGEFLGNEQTASDVFGYKNVAWGVSFNVNDNLSLSYGEMDSKTGLISRDGVAGGRTKSLEITSYQLAYTMGGATIKVAETDVTNNKYQTGTANQREATTVALSLAF